MFGLVIIRDECETLTFTFDTEQTALDAYRAMIHADHVISVTLWGKDINVPLMRYIR